jgi:hypothetical protein
MGIAMKTPQKMAKPLLMLNRISCKKTIYWQQEIEVIWKEEIYLP